MSQRCQLSYCDRPTDTNLCRSHVDRVLVTLAEVPDVRVDLEITLCRLDKLAPRGTGKAAETPQVWQEKAREAGWVLHNTLTTWARDLWECYGNHVPTCSLCGVASYLHAEGPEPHERDWPVLLDALDLEDEPDSIAAWMRRRPTWIANHPEAAQLVDEIQSAVWNARAAVDRPANRTSFEVGPCPEGEEAPCDGQVWAFIPTEEDRPAVMRCDTCEAEWNTTQWLRVGKRMLKLMGREVA